MTETATPALTMQLAEWAASTTTDDLPHAVVHQVRRSLVDYLSAVIPGASSAPAAPVRRYAIATSAPGGATVIGTDARLVPSAAAMVNGTAAHSLELDDGYTPGGGHPGCTVVSAALAMAEAIEASVDDLIRAIALGYEVACRLGGSTHPSQWRRGFHNTPLFGVFGAATAAAALLDLDAAGFANAYGLAGSHASGLLAYHDQGADVKRYHAGKAARDGVACAELTAGGLTGPTIVLESRRGYLNAFTGGQYDLDHLVGDLGSTWRMTRTYQKLYPCCRHVHAAVDAAVALRRDEGIDAARVKAVRVETFSIGAAYDNRDIATTLDAQMSLPYAVAAAFVHGVPSLEHFAQPVRSDALVRLLTDSVEIAVDEEMDGAYPSERPARVTVTTDSGAVHTVEVRQPYGEPDNPMSDTDVDTKFRRLVDPIIGSDQTEELLTAARASTDAGVLFDALRASSG